MEEVKGHTKENKMFNPRLNCGGCSGSHLHLEGVKEIMPQHFPVKPSSLSFRNFLISSELPFEAESEPSLSDTLALSEPASLSSMLKFARLKASGLAAAAASEAACWLESAVIISKRRKQ